MVAPCNSMNSKNQTLDLGRRRALKILTGAAGTLATVGLTGLSGCAGSGAAADDGPVSIPLSKLASGRRAIVRFNGQPVEVRSADDGVRATSLVCTHFGCVVRWVESEGIYQCPCHEGRFDADGEVLGGPPTRRLFVVPVSVSGDTVTLER
jgi:cytochrome b6-f complex iron-sulfur subunit